MLRARLRVDVAARPPGALCRFGVLAAPRLAFTLSATSPGTVPRSDRVPELSRFYGIVIQMFREQGAPHHEPHFHATYGEHVAVFSVESIELISGWFPRRQRRLVEAWAELHRTELSDDWRRLQAGLPARPIAPLR